MFRFHLRMVNKILIFIKKKRITRLEYLDVFHFLRQRLIGDFNTDYADKPILPVNRNIVGDDSAPRFSVL